MGDGGSTSADGISMMSPTRPKAAMAAATAKAASGESADEAVANAAAAGALATGGAGAAAAVAAVAAGAADGLATARSAGAAAAASGSSHCIVGRTAGSGRRPISAVGTCSRPSGWGLGEPNGMLASSGPGDGGRGSADGGWRTGTATTTPEGIGTAVAGGALARLPCVSKPVGNLLARRCAGGGNAGGGGATGPNSGVTGSAKAAEGLGAEAAVPGSSLAGGGPGGGVGISAATDPLIIMGVGTLAIGGRVVSADGAEAVAGTWPEPDAVLGCSCSGEGLAVAMAEAAAGTGTAAGTVCCCRIHALSLDNIMQLILYAVSLHASNAILNACLLLLLYPDYKTKRS